MKDWGEEGRIVDPSELSLLTRLAAWLFFVRGGSWRVQFGVPRYGLDWSKACFARPETYRSGS